MITRVLPGSTIGILGGGQLGRMLAMAARPMGYQTVVLDPEPGCPASQTADHHIAAPYQSPEAIDEFTRRADVATVEFENIPIETMRAVESRIPLRPGADIVHTCQNREREKAWLHDHGFPCPAFHVVDSPESLAAAIEDLGVPCVAKTAVSGYDGKGQRKITSSDHDWRALWSSLGTPRAVVESWITHACEISVICARNPAGETSVYDPAENVHVDHILDTSRVPATIASETLNGAQSMAREILDAFDYVGVLGVELFVTRKGRLLVNELAPRTHNSGHHTIDACLTSQFEQQVRAICNLPPGDPRLLCPAVMKNLLGDFWLDSQNGRDPDWAELLTGNPSAKLHLYGKSHPKRKRKMGHLTTLRPD